MLTTKKNDNIVSQKNGIMNNLKRFYLAFFVLISLNALQIKAQEKSDTEFKPYGNFNGTVFSNFHVQINSPVYESAFEVQRAYFGYNYYMSENFTTLLKLDIGSPNQTSQYDLLKRYAYFRNAGLIYKRNKLSLSFGLIDMFQFKIQENMWDHRYIYQSIQDLHKFGSSADLGVSASYKFNDFISTDFCVANGEGYNQLQTDNSYKSALGVSINPLKYIIIRLYADYTEKDEIQTTYSSFLGFDNNSNIKAGVEYSLKENYNFNKNQKLNGFSVYGLYRFNKLIEVFGRYDQLWSNTIDADPYQWNINKDGSAIIAGLQVSPIKNVRLALNYQDWVPYAKNIDNKYFMYLNLEYKF